MRCFFGIGDIKKNVIFNLFITPSFTVNHCFPHMCVYILLLVRLKQRSCVYMVRKHKLVLFSRKLELDPTPVSSPDLLLLF